MTVERRRFSDAREVVREVSQALKSVGRVDYVTFVPDGEPTLDTELGRAIRLLRGELGVRVAVITNASLLWLDSVRSDLQDADLVSVKVDAGFEAVWRRVNRPHPRLDFAEVVEGLMRFARDYRGTLISETMLVKGVNDTTENLEAVAQILARLRPERAYVAVPTRPPAEPWVEPPPPEKVVEAYQLLGRAGLRVELLVSREPPPPSPPGRLEDYILATTLVHPLPLKHVEELAKREGISLDELLERVRGKGVELVEYAGERFLVRRPGKVQR